MFTHQIVDKKFESGVLSVAVTFTEGDNTFTEWFSTKDGQDISWLKRAIKRRVQDAESLSKQEFPGEIDLTEDSPIIVNKTEEQEFMEDVQKLRNLKRAIELGVIAQDDADVTKQQEKVQKGFKRKFLNTLSF